MSYSFSVIASTKGEAKAAVSAKLAEVAKSQPVHERDRAAAQAAANAMIDVMVEPGTNEKINVSVSGYLNWRAPDQYTAGNVFVGVSIAP